MPTQYERDDVRRRVIVTMTGAAEPDDFIAVIERQRAEGTWSYGLLYDLRHMTTPQSLAVQRDLMRHSAPSRQVAEARGPVAFLADDLPMYTSACRYAGLMRAQMTIEVFREWNEADAWLIAHTR
jgi:hypothetical protein